MSFPDKLYELLQGGRNIAEAVKTAGIVYKNDTWGTANLDDSAVTTAKVADANITPAKLSSGQYGGDYIKLSEVQAATTNGGTFTSGAWQTRVLNTEDSDTGSNCTLSSNQFTLLAGTYRILALAPAYKVNAHRARLYNISDSSVEILGKSSLAAAADTTQTDSVICGEFTIATSKTFEIQHYAQTTAATSGFGNTTTDGLSNVYTVVELNKII